MKLVGCAAVPTGTLDNRRQDVEMTQSLGARLIFSERRDGRRVLLTVGSFGELSKQSNEWNLCPLSHTADFYISFQSAVSIEVLPACTNYC